MDDSKHNRENPICSKGNNEVEDISILNVKQKAHLREYMEEHSGILEGRFYGSFEQEQIESWMKLRDKLSNLGPKITISECKKVYWDMVSEMKRKKEEKPLMNISAPRQSDYHDDEDVTVITEERKEKPEAQSRMIRPRLDGRRRYNCNIGEHIGKRKRESLSPVSNSTLNSNSPFHSKLSSLSPPDIGNLRNKKSYRSRSKSPTRSRGSPVRGHYKRSPYRSRHNRSSSQSDRFGRSKSPSRYGKSRSPPRKYGRSRSPTKRGNKSISRSSNASGKNSHSRYHSKSRSASRERRHRSKSPSSKGNYGSEKKTWEIFRTEVDALEKERWNDEQMYKKNPEKHPEYKVEWKKFYKIRVKELESRGKDPKSYNFESEWAYFWKWKMDELLRKDFEAKKDAIRRKLNLPDDEPKLLHKPKVNRFKGTVDESRLSPDRTKPGFTEKTTSSPGLIPTLRIVTAVEEVLGSLGPQVNGLLSQCVAVQRIEGSNTESLLQNQENYILLEIVREKLMGQLQSKIVRKSLVGAVTEAIASIDKLLKIIPSPIVPIPQKYTPAVQPQGMLSVVTSTEEATVSDLNVPGVGTVDRVAVAQQIAEALVKQGKTDVTEAELQELVNAVLGMAKTQTDMEQSKEVGLVQNQVTPLSSVLDPLSGFGHVAGSETDSSLLGNVLAGNALSADKDNSALDLLMSVVQSGVKKSDVRLVSFGYDSDESDSEYSEDKMALKKFTGFKLASKEFKKQFKRDKTERITSAFKVDSANNVPKLKSYNMSTNRPWEVKSQNNKESESMSRNIQKELSPFSSRRDNSNPIATDDDRDLKIIGAWDSDSDIDLDSSEKTKAPAYEKVPVNTGTEMVIQKPSSFKSPNVLQNKEKEISKPSQDPTLNLDSAIDDLMGSLRKKSSEKPSSIGEQISIISPSSERLSQAKGSGFSSSQQGANTSSNYPPSYYQQNIPTHFNQPQQYGTTPAPYNNQYYGSQNAPNYNANPYNTTAYGYPQNNQPVPQNYYGSGGFGQMNTGYPGYYNYPPNYTATQAHSTNYQVPYQ